MKDLMDRFQECMMNSTESKCFRNRMNDMLSHIPKTVTCYSLTETARNLVLMKN